MSRRFARASAVRAALAASLVVAGVAGVAWAAGATSDRPSGGAFSRPVTVIGAPLGAGQAANTGEPQVLAAPGGRILVAAQFEQYDCVTGQPTSQLSDCVWVSTDGGRHFHVSGGDPQAGDDVSFAAGPGGALLEAAMTNAGAGTGVGGTTVVRSTDGGTSWTTNEDANHQGVNDRPFLLAAGPDVYLTYTGIPGNIEVVRSTDGGATFGLPTLVAPTDVLDLNGGPAYEATRRLLLAPYATSSHPECAAESGVVGCLDEIRLAVSPDGGQSWSTEPVVTLPAGAGVVCVLDVAVDATGAYYLTYASGVGYSTTGGVADRDYHVYLVHSAGPGQPWSRPEQVDPPGGSATLSWVLAWGRGRLAMAYYHSAYADAGSTVRPWSLVVSTSRNGGRSWAQTTVAPDTWTGSGQDHQPYIWDLVGFTRDAAGRLLLAWTSDGGNPSAPTVIDFARSIGAAG